MLVPCNMANIGAMEPVLLWNHHCCQPESLKATDGGGTFWNYGEYFGLKFMHRWRE